MLSTLRLALLSLTLAALLAGLCPDAKAYSRYQGNKSHDHQAEKWREHQELRAYNHGWGNSHVYERFRGQWFRDQRISQPHGASPGWGFYSSPHGGSYRPWGYR